MKLNINDEQGIDLLHFIFERELKPPFKRSEKDNYGEYTYYDRNDEFIGWITSINTFFLDSDVMSNIKDKVCQVFDFPHNTFDWWLATENNLKSWLENQMGIKIYIVL